MPYCTRKMVKYMKDKGLSSCSESSPGSSSTGSKNRKLRQLPSSVEPIDSNATSSKGSRTSMKKSRSSRLSSRASGSKSKSSVNSKSSHSRKSSTSTPASSFAAAPTKSEQNLTFDEKKLLYMKSLLKSEVDRLSNLKPALNADESREFNKYVIENSKQVVKARSCRSIVKASHKDFEGYPLVCKMYDTKKQKINVESSLYLKILRHLGKKHPNIIQTWDVFYQDNTVFVLQELACYGTLEAYLNKNGSFDERVGQDLSKQLFLAMDYMGDMGVSHRFICPVHILLCHKDPLRVKLTGFRQSVVYWNVKKEDIINVPCLPLSKRSKDPDFQAPEVYGDPSKEEFDPISADIWSLGATIYNIFTKKYPYDVTRENPQIEDEIQKNVRSVKISGDGQQVLSRMLVTNANERIQFDKIAEHVWLRDC